MEDQWITDFAAQAAKRWVELDPTLNELRLRTGIRLERIARVHEQMLNDALSPYRPRGIRSIEDFRLLALASRMSPEATSSTEASRLLRISKAATSSRIERFQAAGLVRTAPRQYDKRTLEVTATTSGIELCKACIDAVQAVHARIVEPLDDDALASLDRALGVMASRFL